jgi:uncharacterized protein YaeQ
MTDLTKEQLQEKIAQVKRDIAKHRSTADSRMMQGLTQYLEYLEDELKMLKTIDKT